jgi:hypothetical protein
MKLENIYNNYMEARARIPDFAPAYREVAKQMRINVDILKKEISDHIDKELERLSKEMKVCECKKKI